MGQPTPEEKEEAELKPAGNQTNRSDNQTDNTT
jgi:hypothetical protein